MNHKRSLRKEKGAISLLDDAAQLLRIIPTITWLCYFAGTLPFTLSLLFFCGDMSTSPTAPDHLLQTSLGLAVLYLWMKCWQTVYCFRLHALLIDRSAFRWSWLQLVRLVFIQMTVMPWKFVALPLAFLITLPFGWCYAFFHNVTCTATGTENLRESISRSWHLATLWPKQNHLLILILCLCSILVFANLSMSAYLLPIVTESLFGADSILSRSNTFLLNGTFWLSMAVLAYLCLNPLILAAYVLRCRDGFALATGEDLFVELNRLTRSSARVVLTLVIFLSICCALSSETCAEAGPPAEETAISANQRLRISPEQLDRAIETVMRQLEYTWKLPKNDSNVSLDEGQGLMSRIWNTISQWAAYGWKWIKEAARSILDWLEGWMPGPKGLRPETPEGSNRIKSWMAFFTLLLLVAGATLARRYLVQKRNNRITEEAEQEQILPDPDLNREDLLADELPVSRWHALADECLARGDLRQGMRALHLASMTHLAERGFLNIARSKSNREYTSELRRRAHSVPALVQDFSHNTLILERIWYGRHVIETETLERFLNNHQRIMGGAFNE